MLDDAKRLYLAQADMLGEGWDKKSTYELCNKYLDTKDKDSFIADSYFAAIICKHWDYIGVYYNKNKSSISPNIAYEWLIDGVLKALRYPKWRDPASEYYKDEKAPERIISTCVKSISQGFYQWSNKQKRKINFEVVSSDKLKDDYSIDESDDECLEDSYEEELYDNSIENLIVEAFEAKRYFLAFAIDIICNSDVFNSYKDNSTHTIFSPKKFFAFYESIGDEYLNRFAFDYGMGFESVKKAFSKVSNLSKNCMLKMLQNYFDYLKHQKFVD